MSTTHRLITEWRTDSPVLAKTIRMVAAEPEGTILRYELEAALHLFQARKCHESIALLRRSERQRQTRREGSAHG